jgi:hypothetical protein
MQNTVGDELPNLSVNNLDRGQVAVVVDVIIDDAQSKQGQKRHQQKNTRVDS